MSVREAAKTQRKAVIVEAARALLLEDDNSGFSMRALADKAQVSSATPYNLFGSKQAILVEVLNADLKAFQSSLGAYSSTGVDLLFDATELMQTFFAEAPAFYRNIFAALTQDNGSTLRQVVAGPRFAMWKHMLSQAMQADLIAPDTNLDALAITMSQQIASNMAEWALQKQTLTEMGLRNHYAIALMLLAVATDASRTDLQQRFAMSESALQDFWRDAMCGQLREGDLHPDQQPMLADQISRLQQINPHQDH